MRIILENVPALGLYRHYKGTLYEVIGTATHEDTGEVLVLYREPAPDSKIWARSLPSWNTPAFGQPRFKPE